VAVSRPDPQPGGDRWQTIGSAAGVVIRFVVHTEAPPEGTGRIISVRKATSKASGIKGLSPELLSQLQAAAALPDDQINTGDPDAPEVTDWSGAVRGRFYRPVKKLCSCSGAQ
jgi:hypothetical protein